MKLSADAGLTMAVHTAEPGSPSHDALWVSPPSVERSS
jgi:hypothetical protein